VLWEYASHPTLGRFGKDESGIRVMEGFGSGALRVFVQALSSMVKGEQLVTVLHRRHRRSQTLTLGARELAQYHVR
jgi:hypothetical protein